MLKLVTNNKSHAYDPFVPDAYLLRLASVSEQCGIFSAVDIYSQQDILLIQKNLLITPELAAVILPHRLQKQLEACLHIEQEIDADQLEHHLITIMQQDGLLSALNEHQDIASLIKPYLLHYEKFPLLKQKITIMAFTMPELFVRTLHCSWFSLLIAKEMRFSEQSCVEVFLAALSHDIGMLHLDAFVLDKKTSLTPEDWRHIQEHVYIGASILKRIPNMLPTVVEAVYEHHERCDGTGYPKGSVESELSYAGKIIGLADSIIAIYHNRFKTQQRTWRDVIPVIQMNSQAYFYRHDEILAVIWRRSEMPFKNVVQGDGLTEFLAELLREREYLNAWFDILRVSLLSLGFTHGDRHLHALQNVVLHLSSSVKGSGVFDSDVTEWLKVVNVHVDKDAYRTIEKVHVQQQEIVFHLQRLNRMTQLYVDSDDYKTEKINAVLVDALEKVKSLSR
ncbi:MAG: HD domain-containing protein [Moraxellaceae bacterium]|nr:MAG: HD domain-containing protein [Moraxellaceae bacterium]